MKAIAINGSPRPGGNTEIMLKKVLEPLEAAGWSTEYRQIGGKPVRGCTACFKCVEKKNGRCVIESDVVNEYLELMYAADAIILGSPTYFADVTAELKALIDRAGFVALANGGAFSGKIGAAVVAGMGLDKGEVLDDEEAMRNMNHLGQTIAWLGKAIASVSDASPFPKVAVELG
jgi:multimeric flavodoxin WrbA